MDRFVRLFLASLLCAIVLSISACNGGSREAGTKPEPNYTRRQCDTGLSSITTAQSLAVTITVSGTTGVPTGVGDSCERTYASSATALTSGSANITIPSGSLVTGSNTLTVTYTPDAASSASYNSASGTASVTVTQSASAPTVTVTPALSIIPAAQSLSVGIAVAGAGAPPTGSVVLTSGSYTSASTVLSSGSASITIPAGSFAAGTATLTAKYTPDSGSSSTYTSASGAASVTVSSPVHGRYSTHRRFGQSPPDQPVYLWDQHLTIKRYPRPGYRVCRALAAMTPRTTIGSLQPTTPAATVTSRTTDGAGSQVQIGQLTKFTVARQPDALTTMPMLGLGGQASGWSYSVKKFGPQC